MHSYLNLIEKTLTEGVWIENRTGIPAKTIVGALFEHDMARGFPLLTTKKMPLKTVAAELEFFIKGLTDKRWLQDRNCFIWDEWCNPQKVAHITDPNERKHQQKLESDLGPVYGKQWRAFSPMDTSTQKPIDQLKDLLTQLKKDPTSRRLMVSAWNPLALDHMALPPCHVLFQVTIIKEALSLTWYQRSCDLMLGIPFNIASYALLLHLLAKASGYAEGKLIGMLANIHIYENHLAQAKEQLTREPKPLPTISTPRFTSIFDWEYTHTQLHNYEHHPKLDMEIAV